MLRCAIRPPLSHSLSVAILAYKSSPIRCYVNRHDFAAKCPSAFELLRSVKSEGSEKKQCSNDESSRYANFILVYSSILVLLSLFVVEVALSIFQWLHKTLCIDLDYVNADLGPDVSVGCGFYVSQLSTSKKCSKDDLVLV